jgi:aarF domain-containing kinase
VFSTGAQVVVDYRRNFRGTTREDPAYRDKLAALNQRVADLLLRLCFLNGGIYTKFGQQLATFNHGLPKEYTQTLAQLQDQARPVPFDVAKRTVEQELGGPWTDAFREFDHQPIAAASLAQVHRAVDHRGREVAVKVQYPHLAAQMRADMTVMRWAVQLTEYFFPDVQIQWMFPEFERALAAEVRAPHQRSHACLQLTGLTCFCCSWWPWCSSISTMRSRTAGASLSV